MTTVTAPVELYGLMAEFEKPQQIIAAARSARQAGYVRMDAYTPIPVHGLAQSLGKVPTRLPLLTLLGGVLGALTAYGLQYYVSVISYPVNVGGRPYHSLPAFVPIIFELTVLGAAVFSVFGMLALNGLPMPYHPVFHLDEFRRASRDRFFLCIEATDKSFDAEKTREFLNSLSPINVFEVPR